LEGKLDLQSAPWPSISAAAKDLIRKMLTRDPKKRITAAEALGKYVTAAFYVLATHILMVFEVSIRFKLNKKVLTPLIGTRTPLDEGGW